MNASSVCTMNDRKENPVSDQQNQNTPPATSKNIERLTELLGFDPAKKASLPSEMFSEVVAEIQKEQTEAAKVQAKVHLTQAMELRRSMDKVRKEADNQFRKFDKELGKVINQINSALSGKPIVDEDAKDKGEDAA